MGKASKSKKGWLSKYGSWLILGPFAVVWCGVTFVADFLVLRGAAMQLWSYTYATTEGTILGSKVTEHRSDDGKTYNVAIRYRYSVNGQTFRGDRYRHQSIATSGKWADAVVARFPADSRRTVYYDASDPSVAVLRQGIEGIDFLLMMFLTPFNAVALGCLLTVYYTKFPRPAFQESGGVPVRDDGVEVRAFVPDHSATFIFFGSLSIACLIMVLIVALSAGARPSLITMFLAWGVCLAIATWFSAPRFLRERTGRCDLVIDRFGGRLTLPHTHGRKETVTVPFAAIESIRIKDECKVDNDGDATHVYHVLLRETGEDDAPEHCVWQSGEQEKAKQFLTWLRTTIGIAPDVQPPRRTRVGKE